MSQNNAPKLIFIDGVPYLSVGDTVALARQAHRMGATVDRFADALSTLVNQAEQSKKGKTNGKRKRKHPLTRKA
jgi:hypothetical protein